MVARDQSEYVTATQYLEEALVIFRELGNKWEIANSLSGLGELALKRGDLLAARTYLYESMQTNLTLGDRRAIAYLLEYFAGLASEEGQPVRAVRLVGAAAALRQEIGAPMSPTELVKLEELMARANDQLSEVEHARAYGEGRGMSQDEAVSVHAERRMTDDGRLTADR